MAHPPSSQLKPTDRHVGDATLDKPPQGKTAADSDARGTGRAQQKNPAERGPKC